MSAYLKVENRLVTCPYDEAHKLKESRLQLHIAKCKLNHLDKPLETCPFNATHLFNISERDFHLLNCPDRAPLDRKLAQSMDKNNPFKGRTAVPSYLESQRVSCEEYWDEEISDSCTPGYVPQGPKPGFIIEPPAMAKPAERRALYKKLHRFHTEPDNVAEGSQAAKPAPVPRQPKQPSEILRLQSVQLQQQNMQVIQKLGLGRGRPPRIAANIFDQNGASQPRIAPAAVVDGVINGMGNLGLGRGQAPAADYAPMLDNEEFPTLGFGRGVLRPRRQQNPGVPGVQQLHD